MDFLGPWIPTFVMAAVLAIAGFVLLARTRRIERREAEEREAKGNRSG